MSDEIQHIKDRLSAVEVIGQYVQLKKAGKNYTARCPFHKERTPSFMVSPERGTYMCFGCGEKGDIFSFVEKIEGIDFKTALHQLAEKAGITLPKFSERAPAEKERDEHLRGCCEEAATFFETELQKRSDVADYLKTRGVADTTRRQWRIGWAPAAWDELSTHLLSRGFSKEDILDAGLAVRSEKRPGEVFDRFRGRIMFPLFDIAGHAIAFSGRFFEHVPGSREDGEPAKYLNSPETALFKKSRILYGFNFARDSIRRADCAILVEGQFDVVLSHQSGLPFTVAVSGTALTPEHLSLLGRYSKRLVLALDADAAGIRAGLKATHLALGAGFDVKIPQFHGGKDPADLAAKNPELLKAAVRSSVSAVEFFLEVLKPRARDERAYKKLVETEVLPLIAAMPSKIDQAHFISTVARQLSVPEDAVRVEVARRRETRPIGDIPEAGADASLAVPTLLPLERSVAMLVAYFGDGSPMHERVKELLGERLQNLSLSAPGDGERLRFEFEALGGEVEENAEALLQVIERGILEEDMRAVRAALAGAAHKGETLRARELARELETLARRKEELRTGVIHAIIA